MKQKFLSLIFILTFFLIACSENTKQEIKETNVKKEGGYSCVFESEKSPKISLEATEKYKEIELVFTKTLKQLFLADKDLNEANSEEKHFKELINLLEENKEENWKVKYALGVLYLNTMGGEQNKEKGPLYFQQLADAGIPAGYFGNYLSSNDPKIKDENLQKAAQLGSPLAQYVLGSTALNPFQDTEVAAEAKIETGKDYNVIFNNLVCALRQGSGASAFLMADYLNNDEENYVLAMEYYWRGALLGDYLSSAFLYNTFGSDTIFESQGIFGFTGSQLKGYEKNEELATKFKDNMELILENQKLYYYGGENNLTAFSGLKIPQNTLMTKEEALKKDSKLKEAFEDRWPDELYAEILTLN